MTNDVHDLGKIWPELVGDPENPDVIELVGIERENGQPIENAYAIFRSPDGNTSRLAVGDTIRLQVHVRYQWSDA